MCNTAPFRIGDKVIAIETMYNEFGVCVVKDKTYTVLDLIECKCGRWFVDIGIRINEPAHGRCGKCNAIVSKDDKCFVCQELLRKVDRLRREHIFEITCTLPESVDERIDEPVKIKS